MPLSLPGRPDRGSAKRVIQRAVELGVTIIDTADSYCLDESELGYSERLIAEALREMGASNVLVATKGGMTRNGGRWGKNGRPEHLRSACEASLERLGREQIDLYQLHTPDPMVPYAESLGEIGRLVEEGKVAAVGLCNVTIDDIRKAQNVLPVVTVQNQFNPWGVTFRPSPVIEYCKKERITFMAHSPLGGMERVRLLSESARLQKLAQRTNCSPQELVLAWICNLGPNVVPIPGARRIETVESFVGAASIPVDPRLATAVRRAFRSLPGVEGPLTWLARGIARRGRKILRGQKPRGR